MPKMVPNGNALVNFNVLLLSIDKIVLLYGLYRKADV